MSETLIVNIPMKSAGIGSPRERQSLLMIQEMISDELAKTSSGIIDGHEFGNGEFEVFIDGESAEKIWNSIRELVNSRPEFRGGYVLKCFGPPGAPTERVDI